jgi:EmrB/QacA subfamily drug resistance transporter
MAMLDATVINVALPRLSENLDASFGALQWVVTGYTLTLASFLLLGGALGDRFGRRRVFSIGIIWFTAASIVCGVAPSVELLVAARIVQGVGAALLTPGSLAIIQASFVHDDRARAVGAWSGLGGVATALGPFVGGWLVSAASWRWIFLLNVPIAAMALVAARHVPETYGAGTRRLDIPGAALATLGLAALTFGLIEQVWWVTVLGVVVLMAFLAFEARAEHPMLPLRVFHSRPFSGANAVTFVVYGALGLVLFLLSLVLQTALGYSPIAAGAATLPITVLMLAGSSRSGALAQRIGPRWPMTIGPAVIALGLLMFVRLEPGDAYVTSVLPALVVFGVGLTLTVAPLVATVLAAAGEGFAGVASSVNNAVARAAGLIAVAALPLFAGIDTSTSLEAGELMHGFHIAVVVAAALCAIGALLAWATIPSDVLEGESEAGPSDGRPAQERSAAKERPRAKERPPYHCPLDATPLAGQRDAPA